MPHRKELLAALEKSLVVDTPFNNGTYVAHTGTWKMSLLNNKETSSDCQIFECIYNNDLSKGGDIPLHYHEYSQEVFYQIKGITSFNDGISIGPGEVRIVKPGMIHSCKLSVDGICIVIVHPPVQSLLKEQHDGK